ncbi:non-ribosomal peptide synthetase [Burkholderia paludis]|uniref:non-ribosomal peptide synthetase n=1 Tax=Burkholderia paludis TaxID=1506587 RepID=UPI0006913E24|nr:non-ribosomal peptide synthetase [Burkholderia paludis]
MQSPDKHALARRIAALAPDARARLLDALAQKGIAFSMLPIVPAATRHAAAPLSFQQQRMWFLSRVGGAEAALHIPGLLRFDGALDRATLQRSLDALVARHDTLRTRFAEDDAGVPWQTVDAHAGVPLDVTDLRDTPADTREARARALARDDANRPFDLGRAPLLRARAIVLADDCHWLALTMHHIVSDGWSGDILLRELGALYAAFARGDDPAALPPLPLGYADYALWQRDLASTGVFERQLAYWRERLGAQAARLPLATDRPRGAVQSFEGARLRFTLPAALSARLRALAQARDTTLFNVLLAVLHATLARLSGETDIRIGVPSANRARAELAPLVGFFVNTLVIRATPAPDTPFDALLAEAGQAMRDAHAHQDVPFEQIVEALQPDRSLAANPLFQVKFTQQLPLVAHALADGLTVTPLALDDDATRFDLGLDVTDLPDGVEGVVSYARALFDPATVARFADAFAGIAAQVADAPDTPVGQLALPGARDGAHGAARTWPHGDVLAAWRAHVAARPDALALHAEGAGEVSRAALDRATDRIAAVLAARGARAETRVALCAPRSAAFAMGLIGILKTGAAYVPLDPTLPAARLAEMVADSGAVAVLGFGAGADALRAAGCTPVLLTDDPAAPLAQADAEAVAGAPAFVAPPIEPRQAAYLIYTSGSTGKPKGVVVSHGALADYALGVVERFGWGDDLRMAMVSTVAADLGHTVLFGALASGSALYLPDAECAFDPGRFADYVARHAIDVLKIVPSHLAALLQGDRPERALPARALVLGGEPLPMALAEQVRALRPACRIFNHYGPTETTVGVLAAQVEPRAGGAEVPVGRPLPNAYAQILDARLEPVPAGVDGELYLGGPGVARGYLGRPALTAERFVPDPRGTGERLYRSGDRVRWTDDGSILFVGRADDQLKIRGYRVEPREVAHVLRNHPDVAQAEVIGAARDDGAQQLLAYVVPRAGVSADPAAWRAHLAAHLPDYMVPAHVLAIERMPLTPNGKLDRRALPQPQPAAAPAADDAPPQGELETTLAQLWQQVLRVPSVGRHANFFDLGGDSILSLQIIGRARRAGIKLTPRQVFEHQTIAALAQVATPLAAAPAAGAPRAAAPAANAGGDWTPTPAQARFFALDLPNPAHWNQSVLVRTTASLDPAALDAAFRVLVARHAALRLSAQRDAAGAWRMREAFDAAQAASRASCVAQVRARDLADLDAQCDAAQRSLDLAAGTTLRALHATLDDGGAYLFVAIHHLAIDGVSWRVLFDELEHAYRRIVAGDTAALPDAGVAAHAWAADWRARLASGALAASADAWLRAGDGARAWPLDSLAGTAGPGAARTGRAHRALDASLTRALLALPGSARRLHVDDLLLTAFAQALAHTAGVADADVWVEVEGHGRDELPGAPDCARSVGWFTSLYPVALRASADPAAALTHNRQQLRATPDDGVSFGLLRELGDDATRARLRALPLPNLRFNYLGRVDAGLDGDDDGLFALADAPHGAERDPGAAPSAALALDARVQRDRLRVDLTFDTARCDAQRVDALADAFANALAALVERAGRDDFATLAPADFPVAALDAAGLAALGLPPARVEDIYPLSPMQRGILFEVQYAPDDARYLNQFELTLDAPDLARFEAAWDATVARHPVLRTALAKLADDGAAPMQWVDRTARMPLARVDLRAAADPARALDEYAASQRETPFDLEQAPLMRAALVQLPGERYRFLWTRHHLLLDGWSSARVLAEVVGRYRAPDTPDWAGAPPRYRDYLGWLAADPERSGDGASLGAASAAFWAPRIGAPDEPTLLAGALAAPAVAPAVRHAQADVAWSSDETAALAAFARTRRLTLNTLLQGAWLVLLARYTGQSTVAFGATVAGRPDAVAGAQEMVGLFINTLPIVRDVSPGQARDAWLHALQDENLALREHEHVPLAAIQRLRAGAGAAFDTLVVFENYPLDASLLAHGDDPRALRYTDLATAETTGYPLSVVATVESALRVRFNYDATRFAPDAIDRLGAHLREALRALAAPSTATLGDIALLDAPQRTQIAAFSRGPRLPDTARPVPERIAATARRVPGAVALVCGDTQLDYATLEQRSDRLARRLRALGVGVEDRVAIAMQRGVDMPVAMLAVWKVGAAYVPLDPEYPLDRIAYVLEDAGVRAAIADDAGRARLPAGPGVPIVAPEQDGRDDGGDAAPFAAARIAPGQAAYAIYTSGSTGRPKGVVVTHDALANFICAMQAAPGLEATDTLVAVTSLSFDIAVLELILPLVVGARVHIARHDEARDPAFLVRALAGAQVMQATPATWRMLVEAGWRPAPGLRMFCGGEALPADLARALAAPGTQLWNLYGPTEATVWTSAARIDTVEPVNQSIGGPIANTTLYVLDAALQPAPLGVAGEVYLGGAGLARGYHGRPSLTAERFVPDPFAADGTRMYRTGDLARWRPDGGVEYLSRIDHQVKVRGFRIELGEIEAVLAAAEGVRQAVVIARDGPGGPRLLAYVCAAPDVAPDVARLRDALAQQLPAYMQPAHIAVLDALPLTPNGKLDRRALPEPPAVRGPAGQAPRSAFEDEMAAVWEPLLGVDAIAPDDDFFALGGHSLLATRLVAQVSRRFAVDVPLRAVFEASTLRAFSARVEAARGDAGVALAGLGQLDALLDALGAD